MGKLTDAERLCLIRDIGDERLLQIVIAERDGRVAIRPEPLIDTCGSCKRFDREPGTAHGFCEVRKDGFGRPLYVCQSRTRCRVDYEKKEDTE